MKWLVTVEGDLLNIDNSIYLLVRGLDVISSCRTVEQLHVAAKYCNLLLKYLTKITTNCECDSDITFLSELFHMEYQHVLKEII